MRQFARGQRLGRRAAVTSLTAVAALVASLAFVATAASASPILKVSAAWGTVSANAVAPATGTVKETEIGVDVPDTLTYTITDESTTDTLNEIGFTDALPTSPLDSMIYDGSSLAGTYTNCGNAYDDSSNVPGVSTTITITGVTVAPGTPCTVVFNVAASGVGQGTDAITGVTYNDAATPGNNGQTITPTDGATLTVLNNPTVTFTAPEASGHSVYTYGELVPASYACTETDASVTAMDYADPTCAFGSDGDGNEVDDGGDLDTLEAGTNSLTVDATNAGFGETDSTVNYKVKPFVVKDVKASKKGSVSYAVALPIEGKLVTKLLDGKKVVGSLTTKVAGPKASATSETVKASVKLDAAGKKLLKEAKSGELKTTLEVTFTPNATAEANSIPFGNFAPEATTVDTKGVKIK